MEAYGLEPQVVLTTPLLLSWDGEKMSSSVGNNIPLTAPPEEQFGRTMRIPDSQLEEWYRLVLERPVPAGEPMEAKLALARAIAARSHGEEAAARAEEHFTRVVREGLAPDELPDVPLPEGDPVHLPALLASAFGLSTSEARRLIGQGGVKLDGAAVAGAGRAAREARRCDRPGGQAALREVARNWLDGAVVFATVPRPPVRVGGAKSLSRDEPERLQASIGYDQHRKLWRPLARAGGFFSPPLQEWHWSLKTQQRAFTSRPHRLVGFAHDPDEASTKTRRPSATSVAVRKTL